MHFIFVNANVIITQEMIQYLNTFSTPYKITYTDFRPVSA